MEKINENKGVLFSTVISEAKNWCEEEFKDAPIYKRRMPRGAISGLRKLKDEDREKAQKEIEIGKGLSDFKRSYIYIKGKAGKVLSKEEEEIYKAYTELEKGYKINPWEATILEAKEWCKEKFKNRPIYERRMPRANITGVRIVPEGEPETEEQRELRIGGRLANFRRRSKICEKGELGEKLTAEEEIIYNEYKKIEEEYASKYQRALSGRKKQRAKAIEQRDQAKELCEQYEKLLSERDEDKIV